MYRASAPFYFTAVVCSVPFILFEWFLPQLNALLAPWLVFASVILIGIPHGAIDHIVASKLYGTTNSLRGHMLFYTTYFALMVAIGLLWIVWAPAGMALFLIISIYHFGQADMEDLLFANSAGWTGFFIRGGFIIGLIIFSDPSVSLPIIEQASGFREGYLNDNMPPGNIGMIFFITLYGLYSLYLTGKGKIKHKKAFWFDFVTICLLFFVTGPLIGFALYFAIWHSAGHVSEMISFFKKRGEKITIPRFYLYAMPFTIISLAGLVLLYLLHSAFGSPEMLLTLLFILISVLTLPHMVIVSKMYAVD